MEKYLNNPEYIRNFVGLAITFIVRNHGWTVDEARAEMIIIKERVGYDALIRGFNDPNKNIKLVNEVYITLTRIGSKKKMNRAERVSIALTLERAADHAAYNVDDGSV